MTFMLLVKGFLAKPVTWVLVLVVMFSLAMWNEEQNQKIKNELVMNDTNIPKGWETTSKEGVYSKWCKVGECDTSCVIGEQKYAVLMVWCKESACGDIYAQVNLLNASGVVIGYTNDTGYGSKGDKVQLTLSSYSDFSKMQLTELNLR